MLLGVIWLRAFVGQDVWENFVSIFYVICLLNGAVQGNARVCSLVFFCTSRYRIFYQLCRRNIEQLEGDSVCVYLRFRIGKVHPILQMIMVRSSKRLKI